MHIDVYIHTYICDESVTQAKTPSDKKREKF